MLNVAIFDPWQRSLFSRQRTPGKEPLLAGKERSFKLDRSALSSRAVVGGVVAEKDEDNQDSIRFANLKFRFENNETVINW